MVLIDSKTLEECKGKVINDYQQFLEENWVKDLKNEFPDIQGLSNSNLKYCKRFYNFYQSSITLQVVGQIGQQPVD